jgi:hypothetical protein
LEALWKAGRRGAAQVPIELTRARRHSQVHEPHDLQRKTADKSVSTSFDFKAVCIGGPMMSTPPVDNFVMSWIY